MMAKLNDKFLFYTGCFICPLQMCRIIRQKSATH